MTLKELPYQDGINWTELEGKPAIFNWNGKPMAGTLYLDGFSNLAVRELSGYMPVYMFGRMIRLMSMSSV